MEIIREVLFMEEFVSLIGDYGFPLALSGVLLYNTFVTSKVAREDSNKREEDIKKEYLSREDKFFNQLNQNNEVLNKFNETLIKIDLRLTNLEDKFEERESQKGA